MAWLRQPETTRENSGSQGAPGQAAKRAVRSIIDPAKGRAGRHDHAERSPGMLLHAGRNREPNHLGIALQPSAAVLQRQFGLLQVL